MSGMDMGGMDETWKFRNRYFKRFPTQIGRDIMLREHAAACLEIVRELDRPVITDEAEAKIERVRALLPRVYDGAHLTDCPYVDVLMKIHDVLMKIHEALGGG